MDRDEKDVLIAWVSSFFPLRNQSALLFVESGFLLVTVRISDVS